MTPIAPVAAHHSLSRARDQAMDLTGLNHAQRTRLANRSPGRDSVLEHLQYWRTKYAITDEDWIACGLLLGEAISLNDQEYLGEREITGLLDGLAITAHHQARRDVDRPASLKALAKKLRPALTILAAPAGQSSRDLIDARRAVCDVVAVTSPERLQSPTLRHELRASAHDVLLGFVKACA